MTDECKTCKFLTSDHECVLETKYWEAVLEPSQGYLGQCFVNLKEHKGSLSDLSDAEWLDFSNVIKELESAITKAFKPELFNWTCLMNNAFRSQPAIPHVHWSVVPRYNEPVTFMGVKFTDPQFGYHYDTQHTVNLSKEMMQALTGEIKTHFS